MCLAQCLAHSTCSVNVEWWVNEYCYIFILYVLDSSSFLDFPNHTALVQTLIDCVQNIEIAFYPQSESCSVVPDSLRPHGLYSPWNSPGQNTGAGSLSLLQGIFPTQVLNPDLPHCRQILYQLSHKERPRILERVTYSFSRRSSWPKNPIGSAALQVDSLPAELSGKLVFFFNFNILYLLPLYKCP